ncbi:MAG: hypothetical protein RL367_1415 [Pseudomonadota bacterium]|jgi:hypothetical protein
MTVTIEMARLVKAKTGDLVREVAQVAGVGLTRVGDSWGIKVNLKSAHKGQLPDDVDGVPVVYEVTGFATKRGG